MTTDWTPTVPVRRLDPGVPLPRYAHPGDAGADIATAVDVTLEPGERALVGTGIALAVPEGWACFVHPRSGLAAREGITIVNAPGTVDAGYRGELHVCLLNTDRSRRVILRRGDLIAQLVFQPVGRAGFVETQQLADSPRGAGGHGSTGGVASWSDETDPSAPDGGTPQ
ncbi:dUTP diphosphatase [Propioniciclava coleopterorum]|uniref:Deoxyuridine 5'-triphosphate nucleotidohydrolase n=1 Tax=Propioniciclava coleopterorum TaxID=2714937 RepID=A0A6G7Y9W8_9ACTN|nr:dUTP diphosphatase [Propioniciclava coleopterorum]QIK73431.1 dUTP diphosphatase [Propioniciclava coleopterorum]